MRKHMKAPEKIFICNCGSELGYEWHSESEFETKGSNDIEYTRTDAFIEKAEEFIYSALNDGIIGTSNIEDFIRLFKKHMKE